jgi:hypothetical protein
MPFGRDVSSSLSVFGKVGGSIRGLVFGYQEAGIVAKEIAFGDFALTPEALEIYFYMILGHSHRPKLIGEVPHIPLA